MGWIHGWQSSCMFIREPFQKVLFISNNLFLVFWSLQNCDRRIIIILSTVGMKPISNNHSHLNQNETVMVPNKYPFYILGQNPFLLLLQITCNTPIFNSPLWQFSQFLEKQKWFDKKGCQTFGEPQCLFLGGPLLQPLSDFSHSW